MHCTCRNQCSQGLARPPNMRGQKFNVDPWMTDRGDRARGIGSGRPPARPNRQAVELAAATEASALRELYQLDLRGDRNNVVYDALYQMDVAAYRRVDPAGVAVGARPRQGPVYGRCSHQWRRYLAEHSPRPGTDPCPGRSLIHSLTQHLAQSLS